MQYREIPSSPRFGTLVKCFWSLEYDRPSGVEDREPVAPDGSIEIIFNLSDRFRRYHADGEIETQASSIIAGQMNRSVTIGPTGNVRLFGIRFRPAGAFPFFDFPLGELTDRIESLGAVWGPSIGGLEERLAAANGLDGMAALAERELLTRATKINDIGPWMHHALRKISGAGGRTHIRELSRDIGISERGLERRFHRFIGLTPKAYSRIVRFQRVLRSLEAATEPDILDTAHLFGYYDQSHLINDFQQFAATTPAAFISKTRGMTELFIAGD